MNPREQKGFPFEFKVENDDQYFMIIDILYTS